MNERSDVTDIIDIEPEEVVEAPAEKLAGPSALRRNGPRFAIGAALIFASAMAGGWIYRGLLSSYFPSEQTQALATRLDAAESNAKVFGQKLDAVVGFTDEIKSQLGAAQTAAGEAKKLAAEAKTDSLNAADGMSALQAALAAANTAIDELKYQISNGPAPQLGQAPDSVDTSGLTARLAALEKDVASLKQQTGVAKPDMALLSQSLADLKAKMASGVPYNDELDRITRMVPAADGLNILTAHAEKGLANAQGLAAELKTLAANLPKAETESAAVDNSWWGSATQALSGLITIKTAGVADWQQLALQCADLAQQGDLAKAVGNLEQVEGALPVELQDWKGRALARLALEQALDKTSGAVLREIAARG